MNHSVEKKVNPSPAPVRENRLLAATFLNFTIAIAEIIGGVIANSLSLISDALHNLSDGLAVLIAWIAHRIGRKPSNQRRTFGYKRVEILAAFINGLVLAGISVYLFYEAAHRLIDPQPVKGLIMLIVAVIGLVANLVAVIILHGDSKKNINVKAAYLHLLGDTLSSVAVIIGGVLIYFFEIYWVDPVVTILIGLYILKETWAILRQVNDILMQGTPAGLNPDRICRDLEALPAVANVHHVHIWNLDDRSIHFECHIDLRKDTLLSETENIHRAVDQLLKEKYGIAHLTVQFEHGWCDDKNMIHH